MYKPYVYLHWFIDWVLWVVRTVHLFSIIILKKDFPFFKQHKEVSKLPCFICKSVFNIEHSGRRDILQHFFISICWDVHFSLFGQLRQIDLMSIEENQLLLWRVISKTFLAQIGFMNFSLKHQMFWMIFSHWKNIAEQCPRWSSLVHLSA